MKNPQRLEPNMALFLDFDGTLTELAPRPEDVLVTSDVLSSLKALQTHLDGALAVVSGRPIAQIDAFLAPLHLPAAGLHGLEHRMTLNAEILRDELSEDILTLKDLLRGSCLLSKGVVLEDKGAAVALHYRSVPELEGDVVAMMSEAVKGLSALHLVHGKMVVEAKPCARDKGNAVRSFLENAPFKGRVPVFIGDDVTDEDGIAAVQAAGGIGIKVGEGDSCAQHRLENVTAVHDWLSESLTVSET